MRHTRLRNRSDPLLLGFVSAYWLFYGLFFGGALLILFTTSLRRFEWGRPNGWLTFDNYRTILDSGPFLPSLGRSALVSVFVAVTCAAIALATVIGAFAVRRHFVRTAILMMCALMFVAGAIPRTFAEQFLLSGNGPLVTFFPGAAGGNGLLYSFPGVILGYLPLMLPPAVLALYVARSAIGQDVLDAAVDLGAGWLRCHARVVVPLMKPGLVVAVLLPFVMTVADVVVIDLIGGARIYTGAMVILDFVKIDDWGRAAAAAVSLLVLALAAAATGFWIVERQRRHEFDRKD